MRMDTVENLSKSKLRKIRLAGVNEAPVLSGIEEVRKKQDGVSFSYSGDMHELLSALLALSPKDVLIEEPPMEEMFMQLYQ